MKKPVLAVLLIALCSSMLSHAEEGPAPEPVQELEKQDLALSGSNFALDLYAHLRAGKGNVLFSPESISQILSLTLSGARETTANEIYSTLRLRTNSERLPAIVAAMRDDPAKGERGESYQLNVNNALWIDREYALEPAFVSLAKEGYGALVQNVDFATDPQEAVNTINGWADEKTEHKIHTLLTPDAVNPLTKLVLTNAVYFNAEWKEHFEKRLTVKSEFYQNPAQNASAWMMQRSCKNCKYTENDRYQVVAIPYKGDAMEMVVLLPRDKNGIDELEQSLNAQNLYEALAALSLGTDVNLALPRFRIASNYGLTKPLKQLGMVAAFDPNKANFTGITGNTDLFISDVIHKAFIEVDETGTEAAAATAVIMAPTGLAISMPKQFRADHPFIFLLRDVQTGTIYFVGRVTEPAA